MCRCSPTATGSASCRFRGPAEQLLSVYRSLEAVAATARATGDTRTRGQVMSDELVQRATGQKKATDVTVEVWRDHERRVLDADRTVSGVARWIGPIPSELAHNLIAAGQHTGLRIPF